jgi:hypothetical protein
MGSINFDATGKSWTPLQFNFYSDEADEKKEPDIAVVVPSIAIRKGVAEQVFLDELSHVEALPITVSGQEWVLLNCLVCTKGMNLEKSIYHRDPSGVIFLIREMFVSDSDIHDKLIFTIDESNRSTCFVLEQFVKRVQKMKLRGLKFTSWDTGLTIVC